MRDYLHEYIGNSMYYIRTKLVSWARRCDFAAVVTFIDKTVPTALGNTHNFGSANNLETAKQMVFASMNESVVSV